MIVQRTLKLTIAYDGTNFLGWQVQPQGRTVQGVLEEAASQLTGRPVRALASGRTDTGVHALGQVVSLRTESQHAPEVFVRALNASLPPDVSVLAAKEVNADFHPIRDCVAKRYRYIWRDGAERDIFTSRYAWHVNHRLDDAAMQCAADTLVGEHDFAAFQSTGAPRKSTVRTVTELSLCRRETLPGFSAQPLQSSPEIAEENGSRDFVVMEIAADGFLYNMVRAIAGTLIEVGLRKQPTTWPQQVLNRHDRALAGATAPPHGLFLVSASYA
ncbi:MAG: tRNA pseudouridine(38-40) synthase TruA [Pirellulales bacterium]|nr:tRNA pseudouridine(38-40) synthase TruA [Pirellulales bacterium]